MHSFAQVCGELFVHKRSDLSEAPDLRRELREVQPANPLLLPAEEAAGQRRCLEQFATSTVELDIEGGTEDGVDRGGL